MTIIINGLYKFIIYFSKLHNYWKQINIGQQKQPFTIYINIQLNAVK